MAEFTKKKKTCWGEFWGGKNDLAADFFFIFFFQSQCLQLGRVLNMLLVVLVQGFLITRRDVWCCIFNLQLGARLFCSLLKLVQVRMQYHTAKMFHFVRDRFVRFFLLKLMISFRILGEKHSCNCGVFFFFFFNILAFCQSLSGRGVHVYMIVKSSLHLKWFNFVYSCPLLACLCFHFDETLCYAPNLPHY